MGYTVLLVVTVVMGATSAALSTDTFADLKRHIGKADALLLTDPSGTVLVSKNRHKPLIPASTLKIFTSLVALQSLGNGFRFNTEFYLDYLNQDVQHAQYAESYPYEDESK